MGVAQRLKELREGRGLSQSDLADITGIPQSTLSHYERGVEVSASNLIKLAYCFQVTADYLLEIEENPALVDVAISHHERRLIDAVRRGDKLAAIKMIVNGEE